jgi:hypothetical protein
MLVRLAVKLSEQHFQQLQVSRCCYCKQHCSWPQRCRVCSVCMNLRVMLQENRCCTSCSRWCE